jgi:NhaA family Na+:H+ antiporter
MEQRVYPLEPLFGRILTPFQQFLRRTTAGGIVLIATSLVALALASALGGEAWHHFWNQRLGIRFGGEARLELSLHHWVNDGLMTLFFLLVGLEIKRELLVGELSNPRAAALPVAAALGGMVVPALVYAAFNAGTPGASGWGIPMATDIAFAVGILVLLAWRIPKNLILFLMALAIADDLGAVLVIAVFYTPSLDMGAFWSACAVLAALALLNRGGIRHPLPYALLGVMLWLAVLASGVHATIAGILLAFAVPTRPAQPISRLAARMDELRATLADAPSRPAGDDPRIAIAEGLERSAALVQSPLQRIEHALTPWVSFAVIPVFALANAGIDLGAVAWGEAMSNSVTLGVMAGLVLGKFAGISLFSWLAVRSGLARLPAGVGWRHLLGAAWLGGIGFTMSIFISQLAFTELAQVEQAKLGILLGSAIAAAIGLTWLVAAGRGERSSPS